MWVSVTLETDAAHADTLSDALMAAGAISVSVEDARAGTDLETPQFGEPDASGGGPATPLWSESRVVALFDPSEDLIGRIAAATVAAGIDNLPEIELDEVAEQDWVRLTQAQFDPIRVNERLWIVPSWHAAPDTSAINLVLDPGLAFGTGSHPTTFLCLQWLCDTLCGGETVLDYGCGSGILGIAAARLGAASVLGVDIDDNALIAARDNAANNRVTLALRHSREKLDEQFDIVVANILTNPLCVLAPLLAGRIAPGGRIALAGVLALQADQVIAAYAPLVALRVGAEREGWVRLEGTRC
ncbi:50S ribosomal protein L11 methyltransferase [Sulfuritalea sp.]|uniref:50S ribosomal protein L11 methyltransferase n=1 Tax=Sulfuritalea sp. TaxID=2480090 RepID=UPI001AC5FB6D|nr:50S ribosomal protein L11 methyltransferase [Sulfuritalea sp.]MBN8473973.1 50S ribosomal protein L11 methyltransferase [Sulfuritalea sp.]